MSQQAYVAVKFPDNITDCRLTDDFPAFGGEITKTKPADSLAGGGESTKNKHAGFTAGGGESA